MDVNSCFFDMVLVIKIVSKKSIGVKFKLNFS